jgi:hypothetical protein
MLHLTQETVDQYGLSYLSGYQFVNQWNFVFTDSSMYLSLYPMFNGHCGELFVINFITFILSRFIARGHAVA